MIYLQRIVLIAGCCAVLACSDSNKEPELATGVPALTITADNFYTAKMLPKQAAERRTQAFQEFSDRAKLAQYIVSHNLITDAASKVRLQESVNNAVLKEYIDSLNFDVSADKVAAYYASNKQAFTDSVFKVQVVEFTFRPSLDVESQQKLLAEAEALRDQYSGNIQSVEELPVSNKYKVKPSVVTLDPETSRREITDLLNGISEGAISAPLLLENKVQLFFLQSVNTVDVPLEQVSAKVEYALKERMKQDALDRLQAAVSTK